MKLLATSIPKNDRIVIVSVAALLFFFSILAAIDVATSTIERLTGALMYFTGAVALARNWRHSKGIALVLVILVTIAALFQLFFSALGLATSPVPVRDYVLLISSVLVLVLAFPALVWLWRYPRKRV